MDIFIYLGHICPVVVQVSQATVAVNMCKEKKINVLSMSCVITGYWCCYPLGRYLHRTLIAHYYLFFTCNFYLPRTHIITGPTGYCGQQQPAPPWSHPPSVAWTSCFPLAQYAVSLSLSPSPLRKGRRTVVTCWEHRWCVL
jgi:hypothetical protein